MTFETGGDMQDPFQETENQDDETETEVNNENEKEPQTTKSEKESTDATANKAVEEPESTESQLDSKSESPTSNLHSMESDAQIPYVKDLDVTQSQSQSPTRLAQALMVPEYHDEDPPVPYSVWRDGTSTGRGRTTIELNDDVDELVKQAMREFNSRYDADINKADIREFALAYGLTHLDEMFAMAEEWGIQYNS